MLTVQAIHLSGDIIVFAGEMIYSFYIRSLVPLHVHQEVIRWSFLKDMHAAVDPTNWNTPCIFFWNTTKHNYMIKIKSNGTSSCVPDKYVYSRVSK